jgi:Holliday junction resolvase
MSKSYRKGYKAERQCIAVLEGKGYTCIRSGGSFGPVDVVAFNEELCVLIQVKSEGKICDIEKKFKSDIAALLKLRGPPNIYRELWVKFPRANFLALDVVSGERRMEVIL